MITLCSKCGNDLEKPKRTKGTNGQNTCLLCRKKRQKELYLQRKHQRIEAINLANS